MSLARKRRNEAAKRKAEQVDLELEDVGDPGEENVGEEEKKAEQRQISSS